MFKRIATIFKAKKAPQYDFSDFFRNASDKEKERVLLEAARKANDEQRALVERYRRLHAKGNV